MSASASQDAYKIQISENLIKEDLKSSSVSQIPHNPPKAILLMCTAGLLFGISSALLKTASAHVPTFECAFFRTFVGFAILLGLSLAGVKKTPLGHRKPLLFLRAILGGIAALAYIWAIPRIELGLANGLNQTSPIFVCIFAAILLKERFKWWNYLLVLLAFAGILLIVQPGVAGINAVALVALGSGILSALAYVCVRILQKTDSSQTIVMWLLGMTALLSVITSVWEPWVMPDWPTLGLLLLTGLTAFGGQLFMTHAYRFASATIVAPFIYMSTFSSLVIAFVLWGENPGFIALLGCAIIVIASVLIGVLNRK